MTCNTTEIKRIMMTATQISPIIEKFNIGDIDPHIADICVADGENIAEPDIADMGVNIADLRFADID